MYVLNAIIWLLSQMSFTFCWARHKIEGFDPSTLSHNMVHWRICFVHFLIYSWFLHVMVQWTSCVIYFFVLPRFMLWGQSLDCLVNKSSTPPSMLLASQKSLQSPARLSFWSYGSTLLSSTGMFWVCRWSIL